jgi:hypothetical protein
VYVFAILLNIQEKCYKMVLNKLFLLVVRENFAKAEMPLSFQNPASKVIYHRKVIILKTMCKPSCVCVEVLVLVS